MSGLTAAVRTPVTVERPARARSAWTDIARRLMASPGGLIGGLIVVGVAAVALLAPVIAPYPYETLVGRRFEPPGPAYWLGTDELGRDVLSRLLHGGRPSIGVGVTAAIGAAIVGTTVGLTAGFKRGLVDSIAMRTIDVILAFPALILIFAIVAALGASLTSAMLAIAVVQSAHFARVARAPVLSLVEQEFVLAARVVGARGGRIVLRHLLPNVMAPLIVLVTLSSSTAILAEATLSFLGMGVQPPTPSWGQMLLAGRRFMEVNPGLAIYPGLAIMITVLGFNLLGDALRDVLDPRLRGSR